MKNKIFGAFLIFFIVVSFAPLCLAENLSNTRAMQKKFEKNIYTFQCLSKTLNELIHEMDSFNKNISQKNKLELAEEEKVFGWFFSFRMVRRALRKIGANSQTLSDSKENENNQNLALSFAAFSEWYRSTCYLWRVTSSNKLLQKKLNEANPELGVPENAGNAILASLQNGDMRKSLIEGAENIFQSFNPQDNLSQAIKAKIRANYDYITQNTPPTWKAHATIIWRTLKNKLFQKFYSIDVAVSTWVGDTKYRRKKSTISLQRVQEMTAKLRTGDILFERENWFLSNLFLPGFWKHGIIYIGTKRDLERMGLTSDPYVAQHLADFEKPDRHGYQKRVVEAISDGVLLNSMEEATDADYICALRPRKTPQQIKQVIINCFKHVGRPYDFMFDFQTSDKIICTELIFRCFREIVSLNLKRIAGRWSLSADDLLRKFAAEKVSPERDFDFVFFLDSDIKTGQTSFKTQEDLCNTLKRPGPDFFLYLDD